MKKPVSIIASAALLIIGLVSCPSEKVTPPKVNGTELVLDGGFKAETNDWYFSGANRSTSPKSCIRTGTHYGSIASQTKDPVMIDQFINVPAQGTTRLTLWVRVESNEPANSDVILLVKANSRILTTLTMKDSRGNYTNYSYDLTSFKGEEVSIEFDGRFNGALKTTNFCIDDVSVINMP